MAGIIRPIQKVAQTNSKPPTTQANTHILVYTPLASAFVPLEIVGGYLHSLLRAAAILFGAAAFPIKFSFIDFRRVKYFFFCFCVLVFFWTKSVSQGCAIA